MALRALLGALVAFAVGATAWFHPLLPAGLALALLLAALGIARPFALLLVFIAVLFTRPAEFVTALAPLQLGKVFALGALGLAGAHKLVNRDLSWVSLPQNTWMLVLGAAVLVASLAGTDPAASTAIFQDVFVKILILYFLIVNLVDSPRRALALEFVLVACTLFLAVFALHAKLTGAAVIEGSRAGAVGLLEDPNDLALTLLVTVPFLWAAALESSAGARLLWSTALLVVVGGVISTQSRGGLLALAVGAALLLRDRVRSRLALGLMVAGGLAALVLVAGVTKRETVAPGGVDESAQGRLDAWMAGARMVKARPITGVGLEQFAANYPSYVANPVDWNPKEAHNTLVKVAAETGLLGLLPFVLLLWTTIRDALRLERRAARLETALSRALARSQLATLGAVLTSAFFLSQSWNWFIYILVAHVAAQARVFEAQPSEA